MPQGLRDVGSEEVTVTERGAEVIILNVVEVERRNIRHGKLICVWIKSDVPGERVQKYESG